MPNWCNDSITIEGPADKIRALWAAAQTGHKYINAATGAEEETAGLLNAMVPIGEWDYDRAVAEWGTKWDIDLEGLEFVDGGQGRAQITGWATSAWSPPLEAFQTYASANEDCYLELKYYEPSMSFIGVWDSESGDAYWEDVESLLNITQEDDAVIYELLEHFNVWGDYEMDEAADEAYDTDPLAGVMGPELD
jgi:hypothetical protein